MKGVVSAGDKLTASAGAEMLRRGGNAVDAAVAAAFVSFIAEIGVVHLGGSGIAQVYSPGDEKQIGSSIVYDFFSTMPGIGRMAMPDNLDFEKVIVDFGPATQEFYLGRGSVAVPGDVIGLCKLAEDKGRLQLHELLQPAIKLAHQGVYLDKFQTDTCELLRPLYTHTEEIRNVFLRDGRMIAPNDPFTIPYLARTLENLADEGANYARTGSLAGAIVEDQERHGGLITAADLKSFTVGLHPPIPVNYRDYVVLLPPASSSGGVLTAFSLALLCHFPVAELAYHSRQHLQLLFEIMAATTRARPLWDRLSHNFPMEEALSRFLHDAQIAIFAKEVESAMAGETAFPTISEPSHRPDTTHISVIDGDGMAVGLTTTAGESAGYIIPGTGMIPNNILGESDLHPAGFHALAPGQRINTMMTPTIVLHDGNVRLVVGSGGSIRIRSAVLQVLSNLLDFKMTLDQAVNTARVHLEDGMFQCELGVKPAAIAQLESLGYKVNRWDRRSIYFGGAHSVSRTPEGRLAAAGDDRRGGAVEVVV